MAILRMSSENTFEGKSYLEYNGYGGVRRIFKNLWFAKKVGNKLDDVKLVMGK